MTMRLRWLVIDTDPQIRDLVRERFADHEVVVNSGRDALDTAIQLVPHVVILELGIAEADAIEIASALRQRHGCLVYLAAITARRVTVVPEVFDYFAHKPATATMVHEIETNARERRQGQTAPAESRS
jgi:DNA-binding response OmpR family regulator